MTSYSWTSGTTGVWTAAADWTPNAVPDDAAADVTINAPAASGGAYTVTIAAGQTETVHALTLNGTDPNLTGSNTSPYHAAEFELDGTLVFAPGSAGTLDGSLQTFVHISGGQNAKIVNAGTTNGFIQVEGSLLVTGTNGFYVTNYMQALGGTVTVDTSSIAEMTGHTLFDGIYEAKGTGASVYLGGTLENNIVNIGTIEGPPLNSTGWTELTLNGSGAVIDEWNGTAYVPFATSLQEIAGGGTVDVLSGQNYTTSHTLTIDARGQASGAGMLNLQAGTITSAGIGIAGGIMQGYATVASSVINDGTISAVGGTLNLTGSLGGTGTVTFDMNSQAGTIDPNRATLILNSVSAGQTIVMNGDDTLQINAIGTFAGTIEAKGGDHIVLQGATATSATLNQGTLTISDGPTVLGTLDMAGTYAANSFTTSGSTITVPGTLPPPTITGTAAGQAVTDQHTIAPLANVMISDPNMGQTETITVTLSAAANGTLSNLGSGTYNAANGVYMDTGSAAAITTVLAGLVFTPTAHEVAPGQTVTTGFTISDTNTAMVTATDHVTSVIATAGTVMPTISGAMAGQAVADTGTITPFHNVMIGDVNAGQTETVTVTSSAAANGTFSNLGGGTYNAASGVYTVTGSAAVVTTALDGLMFMPTAHQVASGQTVTTTFTIADMDTAGASATHGTSSVVATATAQMTDTPAAFFGGATSGVLFANTNGAVAVWNVQNGVAASSNGVGTLAGGWSVAGTGNFYGAGATDILFQNTNGDVAQWQMQNGHAIAATSVGVNDPTHWSLVGTGDFYSSGTDDVVFRNNTTGAVAQWQVQNGHAVAATTVGTTTSDWSIAAIGKLTTGAGADSIVFINTNGAVADWTITNGHAVAAASLGQTSSYWSIVGLGDFTGNGQNDILFRGQGGEMTMWTMQNGHVTGAQSIGMTSADWRTVGIGDYNGDGTDDILFRNTNGNLAAWEMQNGHVAHVTNVGATTADWQNAPVHAGVALPS